MRRQLKVTLVQNKSIKVEILDPDFCLNERLQNVNGIESNDVIGTISKVSVLYRDISHSITKYFRLIHD